MKQCRARIRAARLIRPVYSVAAILASALGSGCSQRNVVVEPATRYGYIVIGPSTAAEYGLQAGDTLVELGTAHVPGQVAVAAEAEASRIAYSPKCTRYFQRGPVFLALLEVSCVQGELVEDGEAIAAFRSNGEPAGRPMLSLKTDAYTSIVPSTRPMP